MRGGLIRRGDMAIVARAPRLERSRFDVEEFEETILPSRAGQRVRHDLRGHVAEGRAARFLGAERFQEVSISKTLLLSVAAIPNRFALPVMTTTPTIFGIGEVLLSGRDLNCVVSRRSSSLTLL